MISEFRISEFNCQFVRFSPCNVTELAFQFGSVQFRSVALYTFLELIDRY